MSDRFPNHVPMEERPPFSIQNVPDNVLQEAIGIAVNYKSCPDCGHEQFMPVVPGHNSTWDCVECDYEMVVVG